jgi:hypothetical protein
MAEEAEAATEASTFAGSAIELNDSLLELVMTNYQ